MDDDAAAAWERNITNRLTLIVVKQRVAAADRTYKRTDRRLMPRAARRVPSSLGVDRHILFFRLFCSQGIARRRPHGRRRGFRIGLRSVWRLPFRPQWFCRR